MDWESILIVVLVFIGYFHLLNTPKKRYITAFVKLHNENSRSNEMRCTTFILG